MCTAYAKDKWFFSTPFGKPYWNPDNDTLIKWYKEVALTALFLKKNKTLTIFGINIWMDYVKKCNKKINSFVPQIKTKTRWSAPIHTLNTHTHSLTHSPIRQHVEIRTRAQKYINSLPHTLLHTLAHTHIYTHDTQNFIKN